MTRMRYGFFAVLFPACLAFAASHNAVYLHEGFNRTTIPPGWTHIRLVGTQASWSVVGQGSNPPVAPYAGTGQATFNSWDAGVNEQARLISPAIDLSSATDPFASFWMYHEDEYLSSFDSLYVEVSTADSVNGPWTTLAGLRRPGALNGWSKEAISLYPSRGVTRVFVSLRGVSKYGNNIFVDEFRIADSTFHDIGLSGFATGELLRARDGLSRQTNLSRAHGARKSDLRIADLERVDAPAGVPLQLRAVVRNFGTFDETSYNIRWRVGSQVQQEISGPPLAARSGRDTATLIWANPVAGIHTITAWTALSTDSTRSNDSARITVQVIDTATVFYESFNGNAFPPPHWITVNRDNGALAPWFRGADTSAFLPLEGSGFAANNYLRANGLYLDDYLISPQISGVNSSGKVDSLVFWVRSMNNTPPTANFPDSLMIALSDGGSDTSSFRTVVDYFPVPKGVWSRKGYSLAGRVSANSTVRVAFRYLLYNVQPSSGSGDFVGIDAVHIVRKVPTTISTEAATPGNFLLVQNYPNPFNPRTEIRLQIPEISHVTLRVYDCVGRDVATCVNEELRTGTYTISFDASKLSSGVYYYRLTAGSFSTTKKMLLVR